MDAAQQNVQYHNTVTCGNVRTVIIRADPGTGQREKSRFRPDKLPMGLRGSVINQTEKKMNKENCISLINSPPRLNASLKKTPGQNCRFLLNAPFNRENTVQIYSRPFCSSKPTAVESFLIQTSLDSMFCLCSSSDFPNTLYAERFS